MADNFDEFDDDRDEVEAAEEDALYLAEEVNTDDEGDDDAELASASSTLDEEEDVEDADEDGNEPGFISEEERARSLMVDMRQPPRLHHRGSQRRRGHHRARGIPRQGDADLLSRVLHVRYRLPRPARCARRLEAGAPPHPVRHERVRLHAEQART